MTTHEAIMHTLETGIQLVKLYVEDMTDAELLTRPNPESHHVAWQLGHMISSECEMMQQLGFEMPALPDGFAETYTPENAKSDNPATFHKKDQYTELLTAQRTATLEVLKNMDEATMDKSTPAPMSEYVDTVGRALNLIGIHQMMHAGQFIPVRRKLGKPIVI